MARLKQYYTNDEIENDLYTHGLEWMYPNGTEYKGLYHKYTSTSEAYTQNEWNISRSKKLILYRNTNKKTEIYRKLNPDINTRYTSPNKHFVTLSKEDIKNRFIKRYILQKINESKIIEVDLNQFKLWNQKIIDPTLYIGVDITWWIAGKTETVIDGSIRKFGVRDKNKNSIQKAKQTIPKIDSYLTNPLELYVDVDIIIPADIN